MMEGQPQIIKGIIIGKNYYSDFIRSGVQGSAQSLTRKTSKSIEKETLVLQGHLLVVQVQADSSQFIRELRITLAGSVSVVMFSAV